MINTIEMVAGDTLVIVIPITDADTGGMLDLTGAQQIRWWLAQYLDTPIDEVPVKKSLGEGIAVAGEPTGGTIEVTIDQTDTEGLVGAHYHEAEVVTAAGVVKTVAAGMIRIRRGLIRS
jgi:hypothetical protein